MLPEQFVAMMLVVSIAAMAGALAVFAVLAFRQMRRLESGMDTILEVAQENGRGIAGFSNNVGKIARYSEASVEFQRKVHDHQRVLLTSLNKQMRNLESLMVQPGSEDASQSAPVRTASKPFTPAAPMRPASRPNVGEAALQVSQNRPAPAPAKPDPVPFHELFAAANRSAANREAHQPRKIEGSEKAIMLARLFKDGKFSGVTTADGLDQVMDEATQDKPVEVRPVEVGPTEVGPKEEKAKPAAIANQETGNSAENRFAEELRKVGNG